MNTSPNHKKENAKIDESELKLAKAIRATRGLHGLTQDYVATLTGISQSRYSRLENGLQSVSCRELFRIASVIKINPVQLIFVSCVNEGLVQELSLLMEMIQKFTDESEKNNISDKEFDEFISHIRSLFLMIATHRGKKMS